MRSTANLVRFLSFVTVWLSACQLTDQASLAGNDGGMDGGGIELGSTAQALETSLCGNSSALQLNAPWPMRGGCPTHAARSSEIGPQTAVKNWAFDTFGDVRSSAAVASDGSLIIGSDNSKVYKINPANGAILKELAVGGAVKTTPAISADSTVYVTNDAGKLSAIDFNTFTLKWSYTAGGTIASSPAILPDGAVVFGSSNKSVWSVSSTGTKKWSYATSGAITSSPAVSADGLVIYVGSQDSHLYALNATTGTLKWKTKLAAAVSSSPAVSRFGLVVMGSGDKMYALDAVTGVVAWQKSLGSCTVYSPAISEAGLILVGTSFSLLTGGSVYALKPSDGTVLWQFDTFGGVESTPLIDRVGNAYFGANDGALYGVNSAGKQLFKHVLPNGLLAGIKSSPALARGGALVFGGDDNWIYSVGTGLPPLVPNGGTCTADPECEPGLVCGNANGAQLGKPAGSSACWIPGCENKVKDPAETDVDCGGPCGSCASVCSQGCTVGSQVTPPALEVLSFAKGSFARGSYATYQTDKSRVAVARGDQLRYENRGDGHGRVALFEGPRTNRIVWSEGMGHLPEWWIPPVLSPRMTLTEDAITSPDGRLSADRWVAPAGALPSRTQTVINAMPAGVLSTWLRLTNPASYDGANPAKTRAVLTDLTGGWYSEPGQWVVPPAWLRYAMPTKPSTKSTGLSLSHKAAWPGNVTDFPALGAADFAVWGWQLEEGKFPSSYIPTQESAVTRKVDQIIFESQNVPTWVRSGQWQLDVLPTFGASDIAAGEEFALVSWEGGYLALAKDAAGGLIKIVSGVKVATKAISWDNRSKLVVTLNAATATLSVRKAGQIAETLSYGTMTVGTGKVGMGALLDGTKPAFARLSEIRKVGSATVLCVSDPDCSYCGDGRVTGSEVCDSALDGHCNKSCTLDPTPTIGQTNADCPEGQVILVNGGGRFGLPASADVCWPGGGVCPSACGTERSPCGECVTEPNCANKQCGDDSSDGRGGHCRDLCEPTEIGCRMDSDCTVGFSCGIGMGPRKGKPAGTNICWPIECDDYMPSRVPCGTTASLCGLCPVLPNECEDRVCGKDRYNHSCGSCALGLMCNPEGRCTLPVIQREPADPRATLALKPGLTSPVGTIEGTFAVSSAGTATYSIPIAVPPGRAGMQPGLSLNYNSGGGEGFLTAGWSLSGLSVIARCPRTYAQDGDARGVALDSKDRFCLNGQRLFAVEVFIDQPFGSDTYGLNGAEYRTEIDSFVKVVSFGEPVVGGNYRGPTYFKAWTKDGTVMTFGQSKQARVWAKISNKPGYSASEPVNAAWMLQKVEDRHGNAMNVSYEQFKRGTVRTWMTNPEQELADFTYTAEIRPIAISYGANGTHRVEIAYSKDNFGPNGTPKLGWMPRSFNAGIGRYFSQPLSEVRTFVNDERVATYKFGIDLVEGRWKLKSVTECGTLAGVETCHPPTTFEYEPVVPIKRVLPDPTDALGGHIRASFLGDHWWCDRRFFPHMLSAYFAFPMNLNGDARDDFANLEIIGGKQDNCAYQSNVGIYSRYTLAKAKDDGSAFTPPTSVSLSYENLDLETAVRAQFLSPLAIPYSVEDKDYDGKDEVSPRHSSNSPDLDGDGRKDRVECWGRSPWRYAMGVKPDASNDGTGLAPWQESTLDLDCNFVATDYDGDGADDLLFVSGEEDDDKLFVVSLEKGKLVSLEVGAPAWILGQSDLRYARDLQFLDANGDGLIDVLHAYDEDDQGLMTLYLGTGREFLHYRDISFSLPSDEEPLFEYSFVWDHNGDGRDELFVPSDRDGDAHDDELKWAMVEPYAPERVSGAFRTVTDIEYRKVKYSHPDKKYTAYDWQKPTILDWDGNGVGDLLMRAGPDGDPTALIWRGGSKRSGLLKKITDGFARTTTITYGDDPADKTYSYTKGTSCAYPQRCLRKLPHPIVVAHETAASLGPYSRPLSPSPNTARQRFEYKYSDARTDVRGRGWLGFKERTVRELALDFPGAAISETTYVADLQTEFVPLKLYVGAGGAAQVKRRSFSKLSDGTPVTHETLEVFDWQIRASDRNMPMLALRTHTTTSKENGVALSTSTVTRDYDTFGNTTEETTVWSDGRKTYTGTTYVGSTHPNWLQLRDQFLVGLPATVTVTGLDNATTPTEIKGFRQVNTYDGKGDLRITQRYSGSTVEQTTTLTYDGFGNVLTRERSGRNAVTQSSATTYDALGMYPATERTAAHDLHNLASTEMGFDLRTGKQRWRVESDRSWQIWATDAFGRSIGTLKSGLSANVAMLSSIQYGPGTITGASYSVTGSGAGQPTVITQYNALSKPILQVTNDFGTVEAVKEWGYDSRGRLVAETSPHFEGTPIMGVHQFAYDDMGRMTKEWHPAVQPSGAVTAALTTHDYLSRGASLAAFNAKFAWNSLANATDAVMDTDPAMGTTIKVRGVRGETLTTLDANDKRTVFTYGAFDHLKKRTFLNVETSFVTDEIGQVQRIVDPSSGTHGYAFDGLGLTREYRHNNVLTTYSYDELGRIVRSVSPDGTYDWVWDGNGSDPTLAGRLVSHAVTSTTIGNATTWYEYHGVGGAITGITRRIEGETFTTLIENTALGQPEIIHSPSQDASEIVKYTYNAYGRVTKVADKNNAALWTLLDTDAYGNDARASLLGGLTSRRLVEPATGRLSSVETANATGVKRQHQSYLYDARGLMALKLDLVGNIGQQFAHDKQGRLQYEITNNVLSSNYTYDDHGNLTSKTGVGALHYDNAAKPHQITSTDSGSSYAYDSLGNGTQTLREGSDVPGGRQKVDYTSFDLPTRVENGPAAAPIAVRTYRYDAANGRTVEQVQGGARTVYVGGAYRREVKSNGATDQVFSVPTPSGVGIEFSKLSAGARSVRILHTDHLGSTVGVSDEQGVSREGRAYDSFGRATVSGTPMGVKAGFTGHEQDGSGLINMRGRMYDPAIGRFLTPDPVVQAPLNSQSWNGYSYVMNSPQNATDPSGFIGQGGYGTDTQVCYGPCGAPPVYPAFAQPTASEVDFCASNPGGCRGIKQPLQAEPGAAAAAAVAASAPAAAAPAGGSGGNGAVKGRGHSSGGSPFDSGLVWGTPRASDVYDAISEIMNGVGSAVGAAAVVGGSMVPYVGEAMDVYDLTAPNSSAFERVAAGLSLGVSVVSAGLLPNAGAIKRAAAILNDGGVNRAITDPGLAHFVGRLEEAGVRVTNTNISMIGEGGKVLGEIDVVTRNALIQFKNGPSSARAVIDQVTLRSEPFVTRPVITFINDAGRAGERTVNGAGGRVMTTNDFSTLLEMLR